MLAFPTVVPFVSTRVKYQEIKPTEAVGRFVKCFWMLEDDSPSAGPQRVLPDGSAVLILNLSQPLESQADGEWKLQPKCFAVGQITGPLMLRARGATKMIGVAFHPDGAGAVLGLPIRELTNSAVPLESISRRLAAGLSPVMESAPAGHEFVMLERAFHKLAGKLDENDRRVSFAVGEFERTHGRHGVRRMAERLGWSPRHFERRFREAVGLSPKLFCRMRRFQRIVRVTEGPDPDWVTAAVLAGYYDQSHLIRDFREFSGKTPGVLLSQEIEFARHFGKNGPMSHFSNTGVDCP